MAGVAQVERQLTQLSESLTQLYSQCENKHNPTGALPLKTRMKRPDGPYRLPFPAYGLAFSLSVSRIGTPGMSKFSRSALTRYRR
jgi:hypothetical protein